MSLKMPVQFPIHSDLQATPGYDADTPNKDMQPTLLRIFPEHLHPSGYTQAPPLHHLGF